jgi:hypothetical protein
VPDPEDLRQQREFRTNLALSRLSIFSSSSGFFLAAHFQKTQKVEQIMWLDEVSRWLVAAHLYSVPLHPSRTGTQSLPPISKTGARADASTGTSMPSEIAEPKALPHRHEAGDSETRDPKTGHAKSHDSEAESHSQGHAKSDSEKDNNSSAVITRASFSQAFCSRQGHSHGKKTESGEGFQQE